MGSLFEILFFALIAAFVFMRLFSVLGRKNYDTSVQGSKEKVVLNREELVEQESLQDKIKREREQEKERELEASLSNVVQSKIKEIKKQDASFLLVSFLDGARLAFEMVVEAFAKGDKKILSGLLSAKIFGGFEKEIDKREKAGNVQDFTLVSIASSVVKKIEIKGKQVRISVEFLSEQINVLRNKVGGDVIEGDDSHIEQVKDVWTFERDLTSSNPNWTLVAT